MKNQPFDTRKFTQTVAVLLLCVGMVWLGNVVMGSIAVNPVSSQEELSGIDRKKLGLMEMITNLQAAIADPGLDNVARESYQAKIQSALRELTQIAELEQLDPTDLWNRKQTLIAEVTKNPIVPQNTENVERPLGLLTGPISAQHVSKNAMFNTIWIQPVENTYLQILTGFMREKPHQSVIFVYLENPRTIYRYDIPHLTGKLIILSCDDNLLYLQTETGNTFTFNWRTHTLIDENQKIVELIDASPQTTPQPAYP